MPIELAPLRKVLVSDASLPQAIKASIRLRYCLEMTLLAVVVQAFFGLEFLTTDLGASWQDPFTDCLNSLALDPGKKWCALILQLHGYVC